MFELELDFVVHCMNIFINDTGLNLYRQQNNNEFYLRAVQEAVERVC